MRSKLLANAAAVLVGIALISCRDVISPNSSLRHARGAAFDEVPTPKVRISQVYGAGGNSGATYNADFIELYNAGTAAQDLTGWSVQYASATGTGNFGSSASQLVALSGTINPGQYYLVGMVAGANGAALPTPDQTGTIAMAAGAGKVALTDQATTLGCNSAAGCAGVASHIIDLVGYGNANYFEGTAGAPTIDASHSAQRTDPCIDTNDNAADFSSTSPFTPHNSSTTTAMCAGGSGPTIGPLDHIVVSGAGSIAVDATLTLTAQLQDASNQTITDASATYTWESSAPGVAEVQSATANQATIKGDAAGTATITVTATSNGVTKTQTADLTVTGGATNGTATSNTYFVSEIHYDNVGTDANEAIEIESPAGFDLTGWKLALYDGTTGATYPTGSEPISLSGLSSTICGNGRQVTVINFPVNGLQNGSQDGVTPTVPDGWAIIDADNHVVEFMSYEGAFVAQSGPAAGYQSTDIGKAESAATSATQSLQRAGNGVWFGPSTNTFGSCNPAEPAAPQTINIQGRATALPVGFQSQLFIANGSTDGHGNPVGNNDITWSSSSPAIVSIDANTGIITGLQTGQATITATAKSDGATGTTLINAAVLSTSATARVGHNTELGTPSDADPSDDIIIARRQYTLSYNASHGGPNWVSWNLDATHKGTAPRCDCFSADPEVAAHGVPAYNTNDWINGGVWSRGHMSPSADWNVSDGDNAPTFYLSNMLPQNQTLNSGAWGDLENHLRDLAVGSTEIYIIAGGIFTKGRTGGVDGFGYMNSIGHILVPDSVWKIAIVVPDGRAASGIAPSDVQVIATKFPNAATGTGSYTNYLSTIDAIQKSTGYDFLSALPEAVQCRLESRNCLPAAAIAGPTSGSEGETLTFDASGSSDPDGDQLSYQWSVDGATVGIGATLNYAFPNNGEYTVTLIVSDINGGGSTKSTTVSIANVAPSVGSFAGGSINAGATYTSSGTFTDPGADTWTGTVNYGDGSAAQSLTLMGKTFSLSHQYTTAGTFTVTVTISDGLASNMATSIVTVASVNHAPIAHLTGAGLAGGPEGSRLSFDASTSTDPDGDALTYRWSVDGRAAGTGPTLTYLFAENGSYTIAVTITDRTGLSSTASATVSIANVAPSVTFKSLTSKNIESGDVVAIAGSFTDPGKDAPWKGSINWGDGHTTSTLPSKLLISGEKFLGGTQYFGLGTFTATLSVTDNDGGTGSATLSYTVVRRSLRGTVDPSRIKLSGGSDDVKVTISRDLIANLDDIDVGSVKIGSVGVSKKNGRYQYDVQGRGLRVELTFSRRALIDAGLLNTSTRELAIVGQLTNGLQWVSHAAISVAR